MSGPVRAVTKAEPLPPTGLREVERRLGELVVEWEPNVEGDLARYEIYRASFQDGSWTRDRLVAEIPAPRMRFRDSAVGCAERVRYRLRARDADQLVSDLSRPLELAGEDIGLDAADGEGGPELRWRADLAASGWTGARIVKRRALGPDRTLAEVRDVSSYPNSVRTQPHGEHQAKAREG
jgi:hypothetical protein